MSNAPKNSMKRTPPSSTHRTGFSLVEVTIALGLVSFILVSLLALFSVGMQASRESANETLVSQITARTLALVQGSAMPVPDGDGEEFFFDAMGERQEIASADTDTVYTVTVKAESTTAAGDASPFLVLLKTEITWPGGKTNVVSSAIKP